MAPRGIVIKIEGDGESARRALEMVRDQLAETRAKAEEEGSAIEKAAERVTHSLENIGIYIGIREAIEGMKEMLTSSLELGVELGHLHEQTGISTENLSVMKYMAQSTGVEFDALTKGFKKFSTDIRDADEGSKKAVDSFARLGISQKQVKDSGGDMFAMLGMVADRFATMPDGPLKAASAVDLFGKGGLALIPILNQGSAGIEEFKSQAESMGLVLDEAGVAKMEALHQASVKLHGEIEGIGLSLTNALEPALESTAKSFTTATDGANQFDDAGLAVGVVVKSLITLWDGLAVAISETVDILVGAAMSEVDAMEAVGDAATLNFKKAKERIDEARSDQKAGFAQAEEDAANFKKKMDVLWSDPVAKPKKEGGGEGKDPTLIPHTAKARSDDSIAKAAADLAAEQGKATADAQKAVDQQMLAELDAQHKMGIVSDEAYYAEKLRLQNDELDAEINALTNKGKQLQDLLTKQQGDKLLKRDGNGRSAEEMRTQRELLQVQEQIAALKGRQGQNNSANTAEVSTGNQKADLESLKLAADLEKERNAGLTAQIALIRQEHELQAQKVTNAGGTEADAAEVRALGEIAVKKLQIEDINKQIQQSEEANKLAVEELNDAAAKDPRLKKAAREQINKLNQEEAQQIAALVAQYDALAQELGGPFLENAKKLNAQLQELQTPNKKDDAKITKDLGDGVESMVERLTSATMKGKESFHQMAASIEQDIVQLAIKMAMNDWLKPMLEGKFATSAASSGGSGAAGGWGLDGLSGARATGGSVDAGSAYLVGEKGPEIFNPGTSGNITPNSTLQQIAKTGGGGGGVNITSNVINQTSNPVQAQPSQVSYDSDMKQFIIHTVLEDAQSGGPTSALGPSSS